VRHTLPVGSHELRPAAGINEHIAPYNRGSERLPCDQQRQERQLFNVARAREKAKSICLFIHASPSQPTSRALSRNSVRLRSNVVERHQSCRVCLESTRPSHDFPTIWSENPAETFPFTCVLCCLPIFISSIKKSSRQRSPFFPETSLLTCSQY
jgi:hypothetical protein